jgi:protease stability complex PrcB-like protein
LASVCELLFLAATAAACGGAGAGVTAAQNIPFTEHGSTQQVVYDGGPQIVAATDPAGTRLGELAAAADGRLYIAVFAGAQRTGGYGIRVARIDRTGDTLTVRAMFSSPAPDALVIQVLTSPAQLVSIDRQSAVSARVVVLMDQSAAERARGTVPQSQP